MKNSIKKNYLLNMSYQILIIILPLITAPYLSRVLGVENIGIFSYTLSISTYFVLFGSLGISMYAQREIAYLQEKKEERSKTFYEIVLLRAITMGISLTIFYVSFACNGVYSEYYKLLIFEIIAAIIDISWLFQGLERFEKIVFKNFIVRAISLIAIFLVVKTSKDLYGYFLIYVVSVFLGNLVMWSDIPRYLGKVKLKDLNILRHIKPTITLFIPQIAIQIYTVLDKVMLGSILNDMSEVGNYEQSQKIIKLSMTLVTSLGLVVSPRIANCIANNKREDVESYLKNSFNFVWFLGIPIMFGLMAIANNFIPWFLGAEFEKSKIIVMVGSLLIMAIGLNNVSGIQYLIQVKKQNIFTRTVVAGAILNFILNLFFIPVWKSLGAIISSIVAEVVIFILQLYYIKNEIALKIVYQNASNYIFSGIIMFLVTFFIGKMMSASIVTTLFQTIIGALTYFILLLIVKDSFLWNTLIDIKNRILGAKNGKD